MARQRHWVNRGAGGDCVFLPTTILDFVHAFVSTPVDYRWFSAKMWEDGRWKKERGLVYDPNDLSIEARGDNLSTGLVPWPKSGEDRPEAKKMRINLTNFLIEASLFVIGGLLCLALLKVGVIPSRDILLDSIGMYRLIILLAAVTVFAAILGVIVIFVRTGFIHRGGPLNTIERTMIIRYVLFVAGMATPLSLFVFR